MYWKRNHIITGDGAAALSSAISSIVLNWRYATTACPTTHSPLLPSPSTLPSLPSSFIPLRGVVGGDTTRAVPGRKTNQVLLPLAKAVRRL